MPRVIDLDDPADPRLDPLRGLRDAPDRPAAEGRFVAEGEIVLRQLAASSFEIESIIATPGKLAAIPDILAARPDATVFRATKPVIDTIVGFAFHRGVLAVGRRLPENDLAPHLDQAAMLVVLDEVSNVDNLGGLFRSVSALAPEGTAILLSPGCADPLYRKALRASMGHVLNIPFARATTQTWPAVPAMLKRHGFRLIALAAGEGSVQMGPHGLRDLAGAKPALLVGAEGPGLSPALLAEADARLRIPMRPGVDSLNLVVAASIALHRLRG
jgi:tRNA G18 (ribose-2'-O)-methylase SpoU